LSLLPIINYPAEVLEKECEKVTTFDRSLIQFLTNMYDGVYLLSAVSLLLFFLHNLQFEYLIEGFKGRNLDFQGFSLILAVANLKQASFYNPKNPNRS